MKKYKKSVITGVALMSAMFLTACQSKEVKDSTNATSKASQNITKKNMTREEIIEHNKKVESENNEKNEKKYTKEETEKQGKEALSIFLNTVSQKDTTKFKEINNYGESYEKFVKRISNLEGNEAERKLKQSEHPELLDETPIYKDPQGKEYGEKEQIALMLDTISKNVIPQSDPQSDSKPFHEQKTSVKFNIMQKTFNTKAYNEMIFKAVSYIPDASVNEEYKKYADNKDKPSQGLMSVDEFETIKYNFEKGVHDRYYLNASFNQLFDKIGSKTNLFNDVSDKVSPFNSATPKKEYAVEFVRNGEGKLIIKESEYANFVKNMADIFKRELPLSEYNIVVVE